MKDALNKLNELLPLLEEDFTAVQAPEDKGDKLTLWVKTERRGWDLTDSLEPTRLQQRLLNNVATEMGVKGASWSPVEKGWGVVTFK